MIGIEVLLTKPDDFLLIKETLTRIGIASKKKKILYQSCHLLHKRGKYYICHFKELFKLDGKPASLSDDDLLRRNLIAFLLYNWGLLKIVDLQTVSERAAMSSIKVLSYNDKNTWEMVPKYNIGGVQRD